MEVSKQNDNNGDVCLVNDHLKKVVCDIATDQNITNYKLVFQNYVFTGDNYSGEIIRVKIVNQTENENDLDLIIKKGTESDLLRESLPLSMFYNREIIAYKTILPTLDNIQEDSHIPHDERFKFAKVFKMNGEDRNEYIAMQDLTYQGFKMLDKKNPLNNDHLVLAFKNLARFHATSFVLKMKNPGLFNELLSVIGTKSDFNDGLIDMTREVLKKVLDKVSESIKKSKIENMYNNTKCIFDNLLDSKLCEPYNAICHGDPWKNNMLFKYTEDDKVYETILVDWQLVRSASPITDISYLMFLSTDIHQIENHFYELLELYYSTLEGCVTKMGCNIESCYPKSVFQDHIRRYMKFGMLMTFLGMPFIDCKSGEERNLENAMSQGLVVTDEIVVKILKFVDLMIYKDLI